MTDFLKILRYFLEGVFLNFRRWLTWRRALHIVAILFILMFIRQLLLLGADIALLFTMDWGLVLEISAMVTLLSARSHAVTVFQVVRHKLLLAKTAATLFRRGVTRALRTRPKKPRLPSSLEDDDAGAWTFA